MSKKTKFLFRSMSNALIVQSLIYFGLSKWLTEEVFERYMYLMLITYVLNTILTQVFIITYVNKKINEELLLKFTSKQKCYLKVFLFSIIHLVTDGVFCLGVAMIFVFVGFPILGVLGGYIIIILIFIALFALSIGEDYTEDKKTPTLLKMFAIYYFLKK